MQILFYPFIGYHPPLWLILCFEADYFGRVELVNPWTILVQLLHIQVPGTPDINPWVGHLDGLIRLRAF